MITAQRVHDHRQKQQGRGEMDNWRAKIGKTAQGKSRITMAVLVLAFMLAASGCSVVQREAAYPYELPEQLEDGWEVSSLAAEGVDVRTIEQLTQRIEEGRYDYVHSCLIVKNGKLVFERYFRGQRWDMAHRLYSVTKSFTSALVGIGIDQGLIGGVNETVVSYFPEYVGEGWDHRKDVITLQHLLMMASGLQFDENSHPYGDPRNSYTQMTSTSDWMKWGLEQPLVAEPGTLFNYSSANTHLFAGILYKTSGMHADEFAEEYLFGPLGIESYFWYAGDGHPTVSGAHGGLKLRPRDMAKFGYMYLNGGRWKGVQVVPEEWVRESFVPRVHSWGSTEYGYQWWIQRDQLGGREVEWFSARGYGDQYIALFPSLDLVVVITSGNENLPGGVQEAIMTIAQAAL
jgi:CubicO group peptidase (beta-lactamase class C family)